MEYGDLIEFEGNYIIPSETRNYKGFNYREYLKTKKIYGTIKCNESNVIKHNNINFILIQSNNIRKYIINKANQILEEKNSKLLIGILIGERNGISEEIIESFKISNLSHMLSVSGAHTAYIILGLTYMLDRSKFSKKWQYISIILVLILFMFITNFSISVIRACIMSILVIGANLVYRKPDIATSISLSLLIILLINPFSINEVGMQLSYLGTIGIIIFNKNVRRFLQKTGISNKIVEILSVTISAQIMIMPIMALKFNTISLTFFISNLLASPLLGMAMILGFATILIALIFMPIARVLAIFLNINMELLIYVSNITSKIPLSSILIKTPNLITIIFIYLIILISNYIYSIYLPKNNLKRYQKKILKLITVKNIKRLLIIILCIIICFNFINTIIEYSVKELKIYFIDVGQGDSTLIITEENKRILIDGGEGNTDVLLQYLLDRKIKTIDYILISHFDSDHCNGLVEILNKLNVKNIIISKQSYLSNEYINIANIINKKRINVIQVKRGDIIQIDKNTKMNIFNPDKELEYNDLNNNSIVAKLTYNNFGILFTGDIEKSEDDILNEIKKDIIKSDIIKISHHGSKTSSSEEFLEAVKPKIALIGVGENNKFGHPNKQVLEKLKNIRCKIYRTDLNGEIKIKVNKKGRISIDKMLN